ncbi:uncharacterized protein LOC135482695 isoform X2 [Lineus longissimus]|uniref:uncharacterized protein LOC135482695 isoform X2 n=1 Tax=Lineus longissimus TaxID=88925 RepID=UPI002B4EE23A
MFFETVILFLRVAKEKLSYAKQAEKETEQLQKMEADSSKCEHDIKLIRNCRDESTNMVRVVGRNLTQAHEKLVGIMREVEDDALVKETEEYKKMLEVLEEAKPALALEPY